MVCQHCSVCVCLCNETVKRDTACESSFQLNSVNIRRILNKLLLGRQFQTIQTPPTILHAIPPLQNQTSHQLFQHWLTPKGSSAEDHLELLITNNNYRHQIIYSWNDGTMSIERCKCGGIRLFTLIARIISRPQWDCGCFLIGDRVQHSFNGSQLLNYWPVFL